MAGTPPLRAGRRTRRLGQAAIAVLLAGALRAMVRGHPSPPVHVDLLPGAAWTTAIVTLSGSDPESGVAHISATVLTTAFCRRGGAVSTVFPGAADGAFLTITADQPCGLEGPVTMQVSVDVTATNAVGATARLLQDFTCTANGACSPIGPARPG